MAQRGYRRGGAALCSSTKDESVAVRSRKGQPNKRLKLAGVDRSGGIGGLVADPHLLTFSVSCAGGGAPPALKGCGRARQRKRRVSIGPVTHIISSTAACG